MFPSADSFLVNVSSCGSKKRYVSMVTEKIERGRMFPILRSGFSSLILTQNENKGYTSRIFNSVIKNSSKGDDNLPSNILASLEDVTSASSRLSTLSSGMKYSELVGIYDADGSLIGELKYVYNKVFNDKHCSLCDITHGTIKEKQEFKACKARLPVPLRTIHLDEQDEALETFTSINSCVPCVIGRKMKNQNEFDIILRDKDLQECNKSVDSFERLLRQKLNLDD